MEVGGQPREQDKEAVVLAKMADDAGPEREREQKIQHDIRYGKEGIFRGKFMGHLRLPHSPQSSVTQVR